MNLDNTSSNNFESNEHAAFQTSAILQAPHNLTGQPQAGCNLWMEKMRTRKARKAVLAKSLDALSEKVADCSVLAKAQRATADKQHESAYRLEGLGAALERDVADIKSELDTDVEPHQHSRSHTTH